MKFEKYINMKYSRSNTYKLCDHLGEGDEGQHGHGSEHDGGDHHHHGWADVGAEEGDGGQPAAVGRQKSHAHTTV